jgi:hypothetical protein
MKRGIGSLAVAVTLWLALPAAAQDNFTVAGSFADRLTAESSWADILRTPGVRVELPMLNFGAPTCRWPACAPMAAGCGSPTRGPTAASGSAGTRPLGTR